MKRVLLIGIGIILLFGPPLCLAGKNVTLGRENARLRGEMEVMKRNLLIEEAQLHKSRSLFTFISRNTK